MQDIRSRVLKELSENMNTEQLKMVELAVSKALTGYKVEPMETLPACTNDALPYLHEYLIRKRLKGCSEGTLYGYERFLRCFFYWWGERERPLEAFRDTDALVFLAWYEGTHHICKRTLNNKRVLLYTFFTYMHETGKISKNPMITVDKIKYQARERKPLTDEELETVRGALRSDKERALFEFLYATGCRISEVVRTDIRDIDFERRTLTVIGKGDKERRVYINAKAKLALKSYLATRTDDCAALFATDRSPHRATKACLEKIIRQIGQRSGIGRDLYPHLIRHTFATDYLDRSGNVSDLQRLMGHNKADTTMIYAQISQARLAEEYRRSMN